MSSLDLLVQNGEPSGKDGNWLPSPASGPSLVFRLYLPTASVLNKTYVYPAVTAN